MRGRIIQARPVSPASTAQVKNAGRESEENKENGGSGTKNDRRDVASKIGCFNVRQLPHKLFLKSLQTPAQLLVDGPM